MGCSQAPPPSQTDSSVRSSDQQPNHLVWLRPGDVDTLDPHRTSNVFSWQVFGQVYDTLLAFDDDGMVRPHLAQDWTVSEDGLSVTFNLRDNIQCHDDTVFDAEDVKFTMDRALNPNNPSATYTNWGPIAAVNIVDPLTVTVEFTEPFSAFVPFMADPFASMLCDSVVEQGSAFGPRSTVGTGPWKVLEWRHGDELILGRHDSYTNGGQPVDNPGAPHVEQLVVRTVTDAYARLTDLERNDAHVIVDPPIAELNAIQQNAQLSLQLAQKTGQSVFFQFTVSRPPFDDLRARQAVAHAINPEAAIFQTWGNLVQREYCPVARGVFGNDQDFCQQFSYEYNPEKAKALLEEMGYGPENPLEVRLLTWLGDQREAIVGVFQEQLRQVGIEAELDIMDISTLNARVRLENQRKVGKGALDLMGWAWYDPDILYALWHSPGAYSGYTHPDLDVLLEQTRTTLDPDERLKAIQAVQTHLLQEAVVIPVYTPGWLWIYATDTHLEGFKLGRFSRPLFNDVVLPSSKDIPTP
ncbi:MAG: ABC transporter substrate-binding protein [Symploca sp. SIO2B6]|nr:ABC transporter substrate-binding protein [Symploca sp. SIO2B6]